MYIHILIYIFLLVRSVTKQTLNFFSHAVVFSCDLSFAWNGKCLANA